MEKSIKKDLKLDVQYIHPYAAIDSSIGLNPTPLLELSVAIGSKDLSLGAEVGFDTASANFTKYNAGIGMNKPDYSAPDRQRTGIEASYVHLVNPVNGTTVGAEMSHRLNTNENSFAIGSSYALDQLTVVKTRFSDNGKVAMLCQHEWRPKSLLTLSAEYDSKASNASPKLGLALSLKP
ncbi:mitochondrial outer membrane protein porin 4 [Quercus suber]|uniref:Mitochondrial outer membrane protein porin 4 n=1 Tax=Quercus suber TaxID=58331 RepID=A0AAW0JLQ1_QUESU